MSDVVVVVCYCTPTLGTSSAHSTLSRLSCISSQRKKVFSTSKTSKQSKLLRDEDGTRTKLENYENYESRKRSMFLGGRNGRSGKGGKTAQLANDVRRRSTCFSKPQLLSFIKLPLDSLTLLSPYRLSAHCRLVISSSRLAVSVRRSRQGERAKESSRESE